MPHRFINRQILNVEEKLTRAEVEGIALDPEIKVVQCSSPVAPQTWDLLDDILFPLRPEIKLRLYGFFSSVCDLSFLNRVANVRRFSADSLFNAVGIEHLACLVNLEELMVGVSSLEDFEFLNAIPDGITSLSLTATKSKKPRLDALARFHSLRKLYLEGQQQGIEVLSQLSTLEDVTLRSISTKNLDYVAGLPRLWSLDIKLGGHSRFLFDRIQTEHQVLGALASQGLVRPKFYFIAHRTPISFSPISKKRNPDSRPFCTDKAASPSFREYERTCGRIRNPSGPGIGKLQSCRGAEYFAGTV